jgi:lysozyme
MLEQQIAELIGDEGLRLVVYDDATGLPIRPGTLVKGHPTVGFGRALDVHGISRDEAGVMLANDIAEVEAELGKWPWYTALDPVRRGVCMNLAFNLGVHGLLTFGRMIGAMQRLDFKGAAAELKDSHWAHQVQASRRDRLLAQLCNGVLMPAPVHAAVKTVPAPSPSVAKPKPDQVDEDSVADALNQAELNRILGGGQ